MVTQKRVLEKLLILLDYLETLFSESRGSILYSSKDALRSVIRISKNGAEKNCLIFQFLTTRRLFFILLAVPLG